MKPQHAIGPLATGEGTFAEIGRLRAAPDERKEGCFLTPLIPIATLYLILAFYRIGDQSLWVDEVLSIRVALLEDSLKAIWLNSQCPLYFTLLRLWSKAAGTSEFGLRLFSTMLGLGAVWVTYATALKLFNRRTAAVTALLLATSPFVIWYSQEIRYINLMLLTSLLATYSFHRAVTTDRLAWWLSYGVFSILAIFSFVSVVFLFAAHGLYLLSKASRRVFLRKWVLCQLMVFALFGAWFLTQYWERLGPALVRDPSLTARRASHGMPQLLDLLATIPYTFFAFSTGFSLGPSVPQLHVSRSISSLTEHAIVIVSVGIFFGSLFALGFTQARRNKDTRIFLISWLLVPMLGTFLAATFTTFAVYNVRYVTMALPAYFTFLAAGILSSRRPQLRIALLITVLAFNGISLFNYYFDDRYARADARAAAEYLESAVQSGDAIVAVGNPVALHYYYKGVQRIEVIDARGPNQIADRLHSIAESRGRLWLVEIRPWETDPKALIKASLDRVVQPTGHKQLRGVDIYAYAPPR